MNLCQMLRWEAFGTSIMSTHQNHPAAFLYGYANASTRFDSPIGSSTDCDTDTGNRMGYQAAINAVLKLTPFRSHYLAMLQPPKVHPSNTTALTSKPWVCCGQRLLHGRKYHAPQLCHSTTFLAGSICTIQLSWNYGSFVASRPLAQAARMTIFVSEWRTTAWPDRLLSYPGWLQAVYLPKGRLKISSR